MPLARILVIDTDKRACALMASGLAKEGFEVVEASSHDEALRALERAPAMAFCQCGSAELDAWALCEAARQLDQAKEVPFVLIANSGDAAARERARKAGADDCLEKPLYRRDLAVHARLFAGKRSADAAVEGDLSQLPMFFLLRALTAGTRSGTLTAPGESGAVHFRDGRIVEASAGALSGEVAIGRLLLLSQGPFRLELGSVLLRGSINLSVRELVLRHEPRRARFERALALMGGHQAKLAVDFQNLTRELPRLPPSVEKVVRLFDGRRTLGEALRASPLEEATAAEAALRLCMLQVLRPADKLSQPPPANKIPLFEPRPDEANWAMSALFAAGEPVVAAELPESAPKQVRDWFADFASRGGMGDLLDADNGGWVEMSAAEAGNSLRALGGLPQNGPKTLEIVDERSLPMPEPESLSPESAEDEPSAPSATSTPAPEPAPSPAAVPEAAAPNPPEPAPEPPADEREEERPAAPTAASNSESAPAAAAVAAAPRAPEPAPAPATEPPVEAPRAALDPVAEPAPQAAAKQSADAAPAQDPSPEPAAPALPSDPVSTQPTPEPAPQPHEHAVDEKEFFTSNPDFAQLASEPPGVGRAIAIVAAIGAAAALALWLLKPAQPPEPIESPPARAPVAAKPPEPAPAQPEAPVEMPAVTVTAEEAPPPGPAPTVETLAGPAPAPVPDQDPVKLLAEGRALYDKGQIVASLVPLEKAAALAPQNSEVQLLLALARLDAGKAAAAAEAASRALDLDPKNYKAHVVLGAVHQERGDNERARLEYKTYLRVAPNGDSANEVRSILESLGN